MRVTRGGPNVPAMAATFCVDAGGTRCRGRLSSADGKVLAEAEAGPCNPSTDLARAVASLTQLWQACTAPAGVAAHEAMCAIGGAGLAARPVRAAFLAACPQFARTTVMSDGYAALIGAGGGTPAALIIVGTGVIGHRLRADGRCLQRDGWGWIGGDRGSGAWLGQRALRHALAAVDGVVPSDGLARAVLADLRAAEGYGGWLIGLGPDRLAALAPLVLAGAERGEAVANAILIRAAAHLAATARALPAAPHEPLFIAGGLAEVMRPRVAAALGRSVAVPAADALTGCLLVARGLAPAEQLIDPLTPEQPR